jgi:hypothetical protein
MHNDLLMKIPYYSLIGLIGLYVLIFRNEDNNPRLHSKMVSARFGTISDTVPKKPVYVDIYTGEPIEIISNPQTLTTLNAKTNLPVEFYINTSNWDTVYGRGQFVVNNLIKKDLLGKYQLDENKVKIDGDELKIKNGSRKLKIDGDDVKIKDGDSKFKLDMKDGEGKIKADSAKIKSGDGERKLKSGDKWKTEKGKSKIKKANNRKEKKDSM